MNFTLIQASADHQMVIQNLMQFYIYDFSEYMNIEVADNGLFEPYPGLNEYWEENKGKFPYIIKASSDKYIGFVLVKWVGTEEQNHFSIAEFFILKKYRREGIGKAIAFEIFNLHRGKWEVFQRESNGPAQIFWKKIISAFTKGQFTERFENGKHIQNFESYARRNI